MSVIQRWAQRWCAKRLPWAEAELADAERYLRRPGLSQVENLRARRRIERLQKQVENLREVAQ